MMLAAFSAQLKSLSLPGIFAAFWYLLLFEVPRHILSAVALLASIPLARLRSSSPSPIRPKWRVSILMPGHNEGAHLRQTVMSLREQTYPNLEIVVVDDGSVDQMRVIGNQLKREGLIQTFICTGIRGGKSAALNLGLTFCSGDVVVVVDVDTSFNCDAIERIVSYLDDPQVGAVGGNIGVRNAHEGLLPRLQHLQYVQTISLGRRISSMLGTLTILSGAFAAYRKEAVQSVGGYEVGPGEDSDLTIKLRRAGWKLRFAHDALALTHAPTTLSAYVNQQLRWNRTLIRQRVRRYGDDLNPTRRFFSSINVLAALDSAVIGALLPSLSYIYVIQTVAHFGTFSLFILLGAFVLSLFLKVLTMTFAAILYPDRLRPYDFLFIPCFCIFSGYLYRMIATTAYVEELIFKKSFKDSFAPRRVSLQAQQG
jgi:cellulose synthase/poly-beta-1,6-N-acetylglucosamine synthase-like glycosyltransferase